VGINFLNQRNLLISKCISLNKKINNRYVSKRFEIQRSDTLCEGAKNHTTLVMKKIITSQH
jgi:uncharacterized protein VirK/YbjX